MNKEKCAYCGHLPRILNMEGMYYAQCGNPKCGARDPYENLGLRAEIALKAWNKLHSSLKNFKPNHGKKFLKKQRGGR